MKNSKTIQFKAALLILVFSLNTLLGFACSLGIDMGYNKHHHEAVKAETSAKPTCHKAETAKQNNTENTSQNNNDDCCSNGVTSFSLMHKSVTPAFSLVHPVIAFVVIPSLFQLDLFPRYIKVKNIHSFAQSHHPPIPDIRIAIQSFQV